MQGLTRSQIELAFGQRGGDFITWIPRLTYQVVQVLREEAVAIVKQFPGSIL